MPRTSETAIGHVTSLIDVQTVFDVGAHDGSVTSRYLTLFPAAKIYSFEPNPASFEKLSKRFETENRVKCVRSALSDTSGTAPFHVGAMPYVSSLYPRNSTGRRYYRSDLRMIDSVSVMTTTIDEFCAAEGISSIDYIKLDTQGGEHAILHGAAQLLGRQAVSIIFTEFFVTPHYDAAPLLQDIWGVLQRFDYSVYDLFPECHASNGQLRYGDAIFVSGEFRRRFLDTQPAEP